MTITIHPPWDRVEHPEQHQVALVRAGAGAFGTGAHAYTQVCVQALCDIQPGGSFADLGCGSGVLAITAAKLGWAPVRAVDVMASAVAATRENAHYNGVTVEALQLDLTRQPPPPAETIAANLDRDLLRHFARAGFGQPKQLVLGGLITDSAQTPELVAAFTRQGFAERARYSTRGWTAVTFAARA